MSSNNDFINRFKGFTESIRRINKDNFDNQTRNLQRYNETRDIKFLYLVLAHLISDGKYLNDTVLKVNEKIVSIFEQIIILQERNEQTIKRLLDISKRVKETESVQEGLNEAYARVQQDNRKVKDEIEDIIKPIKESVEQKQREAGQAKDESQSNKESQ